VSGIQRQFGCKRVRATLSSTTTARKRVRIPAHKRDEHQARLPRQHTSPLSLLSSFVPDVADDVLRRLSCTHKPATTFELLHRPDTDACSTKTTSHRRYARIPRLLFLPRRSERSWRRLVMFVAPVQASPQDGEFDNIYTAAGTPASPTSPLSSQVPDAASAAYVNTSLTYTSQL
jgi:hypothetical protein